MSQWDPLPTSLFTFGPLNSEEEQATGFLSKFLKKTRVDDNKDGNSDVKTSRSSKEKPAGKDSSVSKDEESAAAVSSIDDDRRERSPSASSSGPSLTLSTQQNINRTRSSVLNRLSKILERRNTTPQAYKDSDFKQYWMPDSSCKECYDCGDRFTTFRRRHHCRICGQIFCTKCCNQELPGRIMGYKGGIRVCTYCGKVAMSALQTEPTGNVHVENDDLLMSTESDSSNYQIWGTKGRLASEPSVSRIDVNQDGFDMSPQLESCPEHFDTIDRKVLEDSTQLRELWRKLIDPETGVEMQSHRVKLSTYRNCVSGNRVVDWLLKNDKVAQRLQALAIGQALLDAGFLESIAGQPMLFHDDFTLYKPSETSPVDQPTEELKEEAVPGEQSAEPEWFKEIQKDRDLEYYSASEDFGDSLNKKKVTSSSSYSDSKITQSTKTENEHLDFEPLPRIDSEVIGAQEDIISDAMFTSSQTITADKLSSMSRGWRNVEALKEENGEKMAYIKLKEAHKEHMRGLASQMLAEEGLSKSWLDIVLGTADRISRYVHPDIRSENDHMDVRRYVKFKKIPGGNKEHTCMIHGLVFTKNVAHKKMAHQITNPQILLMKGSIQYQRRLKFSSLEPQILQEEEFLRNNIAKISSLNPRPDIVVVEKTVSRLAQDYLRQAGITLIFNVKMVVLERLARFTQACIVSSIDSIVSGPILGFCHNFKVCNFTLPLGETKTMVCFDGCATHLGCTVTLRGGSSAELRRLKKVVKWMVFVSYHSNLEISFCMDEFAVPSSNPQGASLMDDDDCDEFSKTSTEIHEPQELPVDDGSSFANELCPLCEDEEDNRKGGIKIYLNEEEDLKDQDVKEVMADVGDIECAIVVDEFQDQNKGNKMDVDEVLEDKTEMNKKNDCESEMQKVMIEVTDKSEGKTRSSTVNSSLKQQVRVQVSDNSDPLYNYQKHQDDAIFYSSQTLQEKTLKHCQKFKKLLKEVILSSSPFINYDIPYLESEEGSMCFNRRFFPEDVYWSYQFDPQLHQQKKRDKTLEEDSTSRKLIKTWSKVEVVEAHPLVLSQLSSPLSDRNTQNMLADFRARGGRLKLNYADLPKGKVVHYEVTCSSALKSKSSEQNGQVKPTDSPTKYSNKVDCFDFVRHQRLIVLLSSHSEKSSNHPFPCLPPQLVTMEYYGSQDITLGGFLEKFCFRESYSCQPYTCSSAACDVPMLDHVRRIINSNGAIYISLRKLAHCVPGGEKSLMMWNWCRKCRQATPLVPMSMDSWNMSFAKYLELRFHGNSFTRRTGSEPCSHSLHHYFSQYFGHHNIVATFKYYPITKKEIVLPPPVIKLEKGMQKSHWTRLKEEIRYLSTKCTDIYASIHTCIVNTSCEPHQETLAKLITDYKSIITTEKSRIKDLADNTRQRLTEIWHDMEGEKDQKEITNNLYLIQDDIAKVKRLMADAINNWSSKLNELNAQQKKYKPPNKKDTASVSSVLSEEDSRMANSSPRLSGADDSTSFTGSTVELEDVQTLGLDSESRASSLPMKISKDGNDTNFKETCSSVDSDYVYILEDYALSTESNEYSVTPGINAGIFQGHPSPPQQSDTNYVVVHLSDSMSCDFEKSSENVDKSVVYMEIASTISAQDEEETLDESLKNKTSKSKSNLKKSNSSEDVLDSVKSDRITNIKYKMSNFLQPTSNIPPVLKVNASEHHQLPVGKVPVLVYDEEPSSISAYALGCHEYFSKLQEIQIALSQRDIHSSFREQERSSPDVTESGKKSTNGVLSFLRGNQREASPKLPKKTELVDTVKYTPRVDQDSVEIDEQDGFSILTASVSSESDKNRSSKAPANPHIVLQFSDNTAKFYCKIYFAEQFRQLRKLIFPEGEEMFIRSLSRCRRWEAKGGKSGSTFCKTHDNRFIMKQMSNTEVEIFEKFGFEYFQYISKSYLEQKPTALAKFVGAFKIGFRNTVTNTDLKQDILVMENLFYNRKIVQAFDLKGSMRNRLVNTSGQRNDQEIVLMDENLLKLSVDSPLYIYPHAKTILSSAIERDSQFLANNFVMDYSLLVGIDQNNKELVVGIIDYIRTFTWDKKLETWIKSTGGKMPTVVSPDIYRNRFLEAMGRYFLPVPDQWSFLGREMKY